jgi:phosphoglycerate dehydrogenase-like enzyme
VAWHKHSRRIDVEPHPADHVLRSLPNVLLSPHLGFVTQEQYQTFYRDAVENIAAFEAGRPIRVSPRYRLVHD